MIVIPRLPDDSAEFPGSGPVWKRWKGRVLVRCAVGHYAQLDHEIDANGQVSPSLVCPHEGCTWHVHARLEGWTP